jgi:hypothetical protein
LDQPIQIIGQNFPLTTIIGELPDWGGIFAIGGAVEQDFEGTVEGWTIEIGPLSG